MRTIGRGAGARIGISILVTGLCVALAGDARGSAPLPGLGLPTTTQAFSSGTKTRAYPVFDSSGAPAGSAAWRVITGTGNCCENYVAAAGSGRLLNFGGTYLLYSDNDGLSWRRVNPIVPFSGGEGAVAMAPGGDIVGVAWDLSADRVVGFKMDGATGAWSYGESPIHAPFFDRPWVAVVPGPITIGTQTYPYVSLLNGGPATHSVWMISFDGLTYGPITQQALSVVGGTVATPATLSGLASPDADWMQFNGATRITPLASGGALTPNGTGTGCEWGRLSTDLTWSCFTFPGNIPSNGKLVTDSAGRLHLVSDRGALFTYRVSADGGSTWSSTDFEIPFGYRIEAFDFQAASAPGVAAIVAHTKRIATDTHQDMVLKFDITGATPVHTATKFAGNGDWKFGNAFGLSSGARFDFPSLAITAAGKVVVSFADAEHKSPVLALEP